MNAARRIYAAGDADDIRGCLRQAGEPLEDGSAAEKLDALRAL